MSATVALLTAIHSRLHTDTGTGGLVDPSDPMVTGVYTIQAPQATPTFPYIVIVHVGDGEEKAFDTASGFAEEHQVQVSIRVDRHDLLTKCDTIAGRVRTMLDRWAPSVAGWSASQLIRQGGQPLIVDEDSYHCVEEYRMLLADA